MRGLLHPQRTDRRGDRHGLRRQERTGKERDTLRAEKTLAKLHAPRTDRLPEEHAAQIAARQEDRQRGT